MVSQKTVTTDFLIIGSGVAGLSLAIKLCELGSVAVISKRELLEGNTVYAQGGVAAVISPTDSFSQHLQDTLTAGAGLCKEEVVRFVVEEGPQRVQELTRWGMNFTRSNGHRADEGPYELGLEGGHSRRRILHARDSTGAKILKTLLRKAQSLKNIRLHDFHIAVDLISSEKSGLPPPVRCLGAYVLDQKRNVIRTFIGRQGVFLATGGAGKVYLYTTNPDVATGDGMAMAYRLGARMANMEFVQFHPTCLYHPEAKSFLISEAVRGEGAILRLKDGTAFMKNYHPMKELAPRDIVARAIDRELKRRGDKCVYLDIRAKKPAFIKSHFPMIYRQCLRFGIDITKDLIPVVPAAHYFCGGVQTDDVGRTSVEGLWAIGEVACTGLHGANRLASNSLLEGLVFAHRAFEQLRKQRKEGFESRKRSERLKVPAWNSGKARDSDEQVVITQNWDEIRQLMWNYVGIVRSDKRLERALRRLQLLQQEIQEYYWDFKVTSDLIELRNIVTVAELVVRSAALRKESRGLHFNLDHPQRNDAEWLKDTTIERSSQPVPEAL